MIGIDPTSLRAMEFDYIRAGRGLPDEIMLQKKTQTGYANLTNDPIKGGWDCEMLRTGSGPVFQQALALPERKCHLLLAEHDWDTGLMKFVAAVVIGDLRYLVEDRDEPLGEPRVWTLHLNALGESAD